MLITQKEIASRLGVSRQLVSYAINGGGAMSEKTRHEILETASALGYQRNELARAVATGKSRILGILTDVNVSEAMGRTMAGALEETAKHGYASKLMYLPSNATEEQAQDLLQQCVIWRLDGVLVAGISNCHVDLFRREVSARRCPLAFIGDIPPEGAMGAYGDDASAWRLAVQHLVDLGHRRIAVLSGRAHSKTAQQRNDLCLEVLHEFGLPVDEKSATYTSWSDVEMIQAGVVRLLDVENAPTALLCAGDLLAMAALQVAHREGIGVPDQLSVVGFGGEAASKFCYPPLTTIAQPHEEVARHAVRQLLKHIEAEKELTSGSTNSSTCQALKINTGYELIVRHSTARCPQNV